ncbi:50S ribosomal protein L17 [Candidatus Aerophobetes bacterium]|uniref:Large ribosomal subunit protein bL17 n=1 Tax=Aerophobetes bacterium TaxID=2030807 RepID=A0A662D3U2_UNCAE|nr:MAG: 50S ribosomal protein L17 [Candidatus Aerophobetes bacterium]
MRHRRKGKKLGRDKAQRRALLSNIVKELLFKEEIITTKAKAQEAAILAEKMITLAKENSLHRRRSALSFIRDKKVVEKLFTVVAPRYQERKGGYTQIIKLGYRQGDNSLMCKVRLV